MTPRTALTSAESGVAAAGAAIGQRVLGSVAQRLKPRKIEEAAIALHRVDEAENAIEAGAVVGIGFPGDDLAAQRFEHFPALGHEIGNKVVHRRRGPTQIELRGPLCRQGVNAALSLNHQLLGSVTPISRTSAAGSLSWIVPPASAARLWASQAPAARGSTSPPECRGDRLAQLGIEQDARPFGADHHFQRAVAPLGADVEPAAADQARRRQSSPG